MLLCSITFTLLTLIDLRPYLLYKYKNKVIVFVIIVPICFYLNLFLNGFSHSFAFLLLMMITFFQYYF